MRKPETAVLLLSKVKANLILEHDADDVLLLGFIRAALSYAESYQHRAVGYYNKNALPPTSEQAVLMLSSHFYESRDGSTAGFFGDSAQAGRQVWDTCNMLLRLDRDWGASV
ncbi:MAG: head-tail connector protein [Oscillospiraceae bacterium]|nr:head-tail connector protein [Oscillospiraceae bacterium]